MQDNRDDSESPYFDWDNDRQFDEPTRRLIDRIANDPRFGQWSDNAEIFEELAPEGDVGWRRRLHRAAEMVFELTVLPVLKARALQLVDEALANPDWDDLPTFIGDSRANIDISSWPCADPDPRVRAEFTRQLARAREEREVRLMVSKLPRRVRDLLVLASRNADRESLLEPWIEGATQRGRSWTAYYAQRVVQEEDEDSVRDRYSAAAKILAGKGWSKKAIADGIGIGVKRIDGLLDRTSGQDIADDDPLCELVPDLRGRGEAWRDASLVRARKPRPLSRLSVDEKVALAEQSTDPVLLDRLAKQNSGRISRALVARCLRGDIGEDILRTIVLTSPWMGREVIEAYQQRSMPQGVMQDIVIALAEDDAHILLDCDDSTAQAAKTLGRKDFEVVLAFRESNTDALERILTAGLDLEAFRVFVDLLIERLPTDELIDSNSLLMAALQHAVEQHAVAPADEVRLMKLSLALVNHYGAGGNVGEDILHTIWSTGPLKRWPAVRFRMRIAHQRRPLPKDIAIAFAEDSPYILLDCDDATAHAAKSLGRKDFEVVLAFRESDTEALERMLTAGLDPRPYRQLVDLLIDRLPTDERINSHSLLMAVLKHPVEHVRLMRRSLALIRLYAEMSDAGAMAANGIDIDIEFSDGKKLSKKSSLVNPQIISDAFDLLFQEPGDSFVIASRGEQNYFEVSLEADRELTAEYREGDEDHHYRCVTNDRSAVERALCSWATAAGDWRDLLRWERLDFSDENLW